MTRPAKGTPEWDLWVAALEVAIFPPLKFKGARCEVPVRRMEDLRSALDALGLDWRTAKAKQELM